MADQHRDALRGLADQEVPAYLRAHSGLPGPRSDLALLGALVEHAGPALTLRLVHDPDEYLRSCGTAALGRLLAADPGAVDLLHERARDGLWRVREAAAMALQRLGDDHPARLRATALLWATDPDPLVIRAAVAGICEPRLLRDPATALAALDVCGLATDRLRALAPGPRRQPDVRTLRQGLGYCWSVAVAGAPEPGVPRFLALAAVDDPDVRWIVRENRKKARLRRVLPD
ncbi:HEAT repeat domain-containing protein [Cellulomonas sp. RIT-PI-Y]|uniref:HEAT repeat domain-containing protein n=1 Tax=Cellulomonas sp. RIT-PI-Y TaxID=3035297 RepID=UPI0021DAC713|nr:HEAT repeat domain-containing protein [Cellulomonas sp. RIT-PI-Y]